MFQFFRIIFFNFLAQKFANKKKEAIFATQLAKRFGSSVG